MMFKIDGKIFEKFPDLNIGLLIVKGIDNTGTNDEIINIIRSEERKIRESYNRDDLADNPKIKAWRDAYSSFIAKPKKYKCSVENLFRMVLDGIDLRHINKIVDIYNLISLKRTVPVGGDDISKVEGNITLRFASGTEPFTELNSSEIKNPKEGEVVYSDGKEILCRRWNWRECDKSKMTEETKDVALVVEGLPPVNSEEIERILNDLNGLVEKYCGGKSVSHILNREKNGVTF